MKTRVQYRPLDGHGERDFTVGKAITLPLLNASEGSESTVKSFKKGARYSGQPVTMEIIRNDDGIWVTLGEVAGFMAEEPNGVFLIPMELVYLPDENDSLKEDTEVVEQVDKESKGQQIAKEIIDETHNISEKVEEKLENFNPKNTLGFSYKQLIVMLALGVIVVKLVK